MYLSYFYDTLCSVCIVCTMCECVCVVLMCVFVKRDAYLLNWQSEFNNVVKSSYISRLSQLLCSWLVYSHGVNLIHALLQNQQEQSGMARDRL